MQKPDGKFIVCPVDGKIRLYTDCFGCNKIIQVLEFADSVRVECEHNYVPKFIQSVSAEGIGVKSL